MTTSNILHRYFTLSIVTILASCAQIVAPTGGEKDTVPPKVEKETPENKNTSFNEKKITIHFDEFVQLKDVDDQLVISPPMEEKPIVEVEGKNIVIEPRGKLLPVTTYTINFGNSITDNHENTVLSNYSYVFSTGPFIDTLTVKGSIQNAYTAKPEKGILVCLYPVDSFTDSTILKRKPIYFTKTADNGQFKINNLPPDLFRLVAFKDDNKNLKYDQNEPISFIERSISTTDTLPHTALLLFKPDPYPIDKLIDTTGKNIGSFKFVIFKPYKATVKPLIDSVYYSRLKPGKEHLDTITIYSTAFKTDSIWFKYKAEEGDTSFFVRPSKTAKPQKFEASIQKNIELTDSFTILFNLPISKVLTDTPFIQLYEDTNLVKPKVTYNKGGESLKLYYPLKEYTHYTLEYKDSVFTDIYGGYNKKEKVNFTTKGLKDYSSLILNLTHPGNGKQYIIEMVSEDETKVYKTFTITADKKFTLDYVLPAKYKIKITEDTNQNGIWDNGNYRAKTQPEKVFYYPELLTLRAYWDLEQTIDLNTIVD